MALFQYTESQQGVQTQPFQVNSQPNAAAATAFAGIQEGLLQALKGATAIKQDISETNFRAAKVQLQEDVNYMTTRLADADFETQKKLVEEFQTKTNQFNNPKNKYEQELYANYQSQFGKFATDLIQSGVEDRYTTNLLDQNTGILTFGQDFNNLNSYEKREAKLAEYDALFITPLQGRDDKYTKDLLAKATAAKDKFNTALTTERIAIKDNTVTGNAFDLIVTSMQVEGSLTAENYELAKAEVAQRSDWETKSTEIKNKLAASAIYAIINNNVTKPTTRENALEFKKQLDDFIKIEPNIQDKDVLKSAYNALATFNKTIDYNEVTSLGLKVNTPRYPMNEVERDAQDLADRGVITPVQQEAYVYNGVETRKVKKTSDQAAAAYAAHDMTTLVDLYNKGSGGVVVTVAKANITNELAKNAQNMPLDKALDIAFKNVKEFNDNGIYLGKIEQIENILDYPANGKIQTEEDVALFIATVDQAKKNDYSSSTLQKNNNDALVLKTWSKLGVPDIVEKYRAFKTNPKAVSDADALIAYNNLVDNEFSFRNLTASNNIQLKNALLPAIRAGLKAGLSVSDVEGWENLIEDNYYDVGSYFGYNQRIMLPKDSPISNKNIYDNVKKHYPNSVVVPVDILDGNGDWLIIPKKGEGVRVSAESLLYKAKQKKVIKKGK